MEAKSGGARSVPQIFIGDTHVGGCDELYALEKDGRLDPLACLKFNPFPALDKARGQPEYAAQ